MNTNISEDLVQIVILDYQVFMCRYIIKDILIKNLLATLKTNIPIQNFGEF